MDLALLALRIVVGLLFVGHGMQKLFGLFGGSGPAGTGAYFEQAGLRPGRPYAVLAGWGEFGAGLLLVLGLLTPFAAAAIIAVMTAAVIAVHARNGLWNINRGFEYNLVIATVAFALACAGAGSASLDHAFGLDLGGVGWGVAALAAGLLGGTAAVVGARVYGRRHTHDPGMHPA